VTRFVLLILIAACSKGSATGAIDAAPTIDAKEIDSAPGVYAHRIMIDGIDDFLSAEQFSTTSTGYDARVTWDADNLYIGYSGADFDPAAADTATKWLFIYLDVDPGMPNGALVNETYTTQGATFPAGFRADYYVRWRCDATLLTLKKYTGAAWADDATVPPAARGGSFVEVAIPRATLGASASKMSVVAWMINEKANVESSYAGLYAGNFVDGYAANLALTKFLKIDFAAARDPNDPMNQGP
jgi:hypothetical protein